MTTQERVQRVKDEISGVSSLYNVTDWEKNFLSSVQNQHNLTPKQERILAKIEEKVFGGES